MQNGERNIVASPHKNISYLSLSIVIYISYLSLIYNPAIQYVFPSRQLHIQKFTVETLEQGVKYLQS